MTDHPPIHSSLIEKLKAVSQWTDIDGKCEAFEYVEMEDIERIVRQHTPTPDTGDLPPHKCERGLRPGFCHICGKTLTPSEISVMGGEPSGSRKAPVSKGAIPDSSPTNLDDVETPNNPGHHTALNKQGSPTDAQDGGSLQPDEWSRLEAARNAAGAAIVKYLNTYLGKKWIMEGEELGGTYYKSHEATEMAWSVFYALYPFLRQPMPVSPQPDEKALLEGLKALFADHFDEYEVGNGSSFLTPEDVLKFMRPYLRQPEPVSNSQPNDCRAAFEEGARGYFHDGPVHPALYRSDNVRAGQYFHSEVETAWRFFKFAWETRPERESGLLTEDESKEAIRAMQEAVTEYYGAPKSPLDDDDVQVMLAALMQHFDICRRGSGE